jgi:hypothetical protein
VNNFVYYQSGTFLIVRGFEELVFRSLNKCLMGIQWVYVFIMKFYLLWYLHLHPSGMTKLTLWFIYQLQNTLINQGLHCMWSPCMSIDVWFNLKTHISLQSHQTWSLPNAWNTHIYMFWFHSTPNGDQTLILVMFVFQFGTTSPFTLLSWSLFIHNSIRYQLCKRAFASKDIAF